MAIISFNDQFTRLAGAVQAAADLARYLRDTQGDMPVYVLSQFWDAMRHSNELAAGVLTLAVANVPAAEAALGNFTGAPASVAEMQAAFGAIVAASEGWNGAVTAWIAASLTAPDLLAVREVTLNGVTSKVLQFAEFIPGATFDPLRGSAELGALIAAFEAAGATA